MFCAIIGLVAAGSEPPRPTFSESFSVHTVELDDTLNGSVSVRQTLRRDARLQRSWMMAVGTLVGGAEEQIMRCDIHPTGWVVVAGGPSASNVSTWSCSNMSISSDPQDCSLGQFWSPLPDNASYVGRERMDGRECNKWEYWLLGERYALWASTESEAVPVATGKTWTSHPGYHLWRILWRDFRPGPPPLSDFKLTAGISCPNATEVNPPSVGPMLS